jgi:hypothetical protein
MRVLDTIFVHAQLPRHAAVAQDAPGEWLMAAQPFGDGSLTSFDAGRETLVVVERAVVDPDRPADLHVIVVAMNGDTLFQRAVPYEPVPLERASVERVIAATAERWARSRPTSGDEASRAGRYRDLAAEVVFAPTYHPAATDVVLGRDGTIWILAGGPPTGERATWLVLDERGEPLARVRLPSSLAVRTADRRHVWGTQTDDGGVPYVVRVTLGR